MIWGVGGGRGWKRDLGMTEVDIYSAAIAGGCSAFFGLERGVK